jgi:dihydrofolate reductase
MQCSVFCAMSLDGYIARKDNNLDWLMGSDPDAAGGPPPDSGYNEFIASVDYVVLGRNTFDVVLKMMPDRWFYSKPVVVLTHRPLDLPPIAKGKAEAAKGTPREIVAMMEKRGAKRLYIDGGQTIQEFLNAGLIDDLTIGHIPVLIGEGIPLFGRVPKDIKLQIVSSRVQMSGGAVQTTYRVIR